MRGFLDRYLQFFENAIGLTEGLGWRLPASTSLPTCAEPREGEERRVKGSSGVASRKVRCEYDGSAYAWEEVGGAALAGLLIAQTADYTGADVNTAQKVFNASTNGAATLAASTSYLMEGVYHIHTTGTTSRIFYVLFGGTATLTSIGYNVMWTQPATEVGGSVLSYFHNAATEISLTGAIATATHHDVLIRGIVRVNAAGTFIPQFRFSAAPGVAPVVLRNSFFRLTPIGSNTVAAVGSWS